MKLIPNIGFKRSHEIQQMQRLIGMELKVGPGHSPLSCRGHTQVPKSPLLTITALSFCVSPSTVLPNMPKPSFSYYKMC